VSTSTPLFQVDAFTDRAFAGNPAGVCLLDGPADSSWMQAVAAEVNVAETAFAHPLGGDRWSLRWFTPTVEVPLCGHATLATAHVLRGEGHALPLRFETASGELRAAPSPGGDLIELDLPANPPEPADLPQEVARALGVEVVAAGLAGAGMWLVEVPSAADVRAAAPDLAALAAVTSHGVTITAAGDEPGVAVVSRFFAPAIGIDEDPVTGAAHCLLAPWWAPRAGTAFAAHQVSARGGSLQVRLEGDRVHLGGRAVTVFAGSLLAPPP
jgi:PhzF family phenazine biosynthesis protein